MCAASTLPKPYDQVVSSVAAVRSSSALVDARNIDAHR